MIESTHNDIDHYIVLNPDMYFSETLVSYLIEGSKILKNEYFIITPQIPKLWDSTWDVISHPQYASVPYDEWNNLDAFDVRNFNKNLTKDVVLTPNDVHKWAGWMDLCNSKMWDNFYVGIKEWVGYGPCDWYSMLLSQHVKSKGVDFQQYILENQIVCEYEMGPLKNKNFSKYYKDMIVLNDIPNQRKQFESKMQEYLNKGMQQLINKKIILN
jgi:hypothetical protein